MKTIKRIRQGLDEIKELLRIFRYRWCAILAFVFFALNLALVIWRIVPLAETRPFLPLHYNIYFGVDRLGPWWQIFFVPSIGFILLIVNLIAETYLFRQEKMLATLFAVSTVFIELIFFVAIGLIVLLNLSYAA